MSSSEQYSAPSGGARWVQWGQTKWHIQRSGESQTVCGRDVPTAARTTRYQPSPCYRCKRDAEALEAAERERKTLADAAREQAEENLQDNRDGKFLVVRCKLCGLQHVRLPTRGVTSWCVSAHHESDLEVVEAQGPKWIGA